MGDTKNTGYMMANQYMGGIHYKVHNEDSQNFNI